MRQKSAALFTILAISSGIPSARAQTAPDLSRYDCARVGDATITLGSRHIGQVIAGTYTEWRTYITVDAPARLVCIEQLRPDSRQLDAPAAAALLQASAKVGAPNPERGQSVEIEPPAGSSVKDSVPAAPLPRAVDPANGTERPRAFDPNGFAPATKRMDGPSTPAVAPPATSSSTLERPQTVGVDDRTRVSTATSSTYPYNTVGFLSHTYPNGASFRCSGVIVSLYVVLTAGHCVHNNEEGGFIATARFYPGQNEISSSSPTTRPYGTKSDLLYTRTTSAWTDISGPDSHPTTDYRYDLGALQFATPFTHTSTFMPVVYSDTTLTAYNVGYPATAGGAATEGQWQTNGTETSSSRFTLRSSGVRAFAMDATGGQSGSPFFVLDPITGAQQLTGVLAYGDDLDDLAGGPWYGGDNQSLVSTWLAWTPTSSTANSTSGLRVPTVFDSTQPTASSFLRFFNTGTTAATVDVTLASYDDGTLRATWTSPSIPPNASRQFDIATIENEATGGTVVKRGYHTISIRPHFSGYFQHVLWRRADGTITNITACDTRVTSDATRLMNVHSSLLASGYPATIAVHNTGTTAVSVTLGIFDATTGTRLGGYATGAIPANGQVVRTIAQIESGAGISPGASTYHYNIKTETTLTGTLQYLLTNTQAGVMTDMTSFCTLTAQ